MDLHERAVAAVEIGGLLCHWAALQFGISVSTWRLSEVLRLRETGSVAAGQMGAHKPRVISAEPDAWLPEPAKARDFTLRGLVLGLSWACPGLGVGLSPNPTGAASRSIIGRSKTSSMTRSRASKKRAAGERDRSSVAHRRVRWLKYRVAQVSSRVSSGAGTKTASSLRVWSLSRYEDRPSSRAIPAAQGQSRMPVHSHR